MTAACELARADRRCTTVERRAVRWTPHCLFRAAVLRTHSWPGGLRYLCLGWLSVYYQSLAMRTAQFNSAQSALSTIYAVGSQYE